MQCPECGQELDLQYEHCAQCGAPIELQSEGRKICPCCQKLYPPDEDFCHECALSLFDLDAFRHQKIANAPYQSAPVTKNISLCPDGMYRWVYELNLFTNWTVLFTVCKIFLGIIAVGFGIIGGIDVLQNGYSIEGLLGWLQSAAIACGLMIGLSVLGYFVYAIMQGGKYCVLFEMDNYQVWHIQMPAQQKKAQILGSITALAGFASGCLTAAGAGLLSAGKTSQNSVFESVTKATVIRRRNVIKLDYALSHNQIYAEDADFDFVWHHIKSHLGRNCFIRE